MWISGESGVCGSVVRVVCVWISAREWCVWISGESGVCGSVHESGVCGSVVRVVCVDQW